MKFVYSLLLLAITSCSTPNNLTPYSPATAQRNCTLQATGNKIRVTGIYKNQSETTNFSFTIPRHNLIQFTEVSDYSQTTKTKGGGSWSGGGLSGGFAFLNTSYKPYFLELHFLQLSDCACHHPELYFANGRYNIKAEQGAAANP
jgi:hypothetical protein